MSVLWFYWRFMVFVWRDYYFASEDLTGMMRQIAKLNDALMLQGLPGLEGPVGPMGYPGCNGSKVSYRFKKKLSYLHLHDWLLLK